MTASDRRDCADTVVVSDADNTLWDTDALYVEAHLTLLASVERDISARVPGDARARLRFIRDIDQRIAASHPARLRYPPVLLAAGTRLALTQSPSSLVAEGVGSAQIVNEADIEHAEEFSSMLTSRVPALRPGVAAGLRMLKAASACILVATEGDVDRCRHFLEAHDLVGYVDLVASGVKTVLFFAELRREYPASLLFCVGDQLDRDVEFAGQAGFTTIHFPSRFVPFWAAARDVVPDHIVSSYEDVAAIVLREAATMTRSL